MAVMMIIEWQGVSADDYARLNDRLGIHDDSDAPEGLVEHVAALTDDEELVICDVWESDEALESFFDTRLGPAIAELGLSQPDPRTAPVHNHRPGTAGEGNVLILIEAPGMTTDDYDAMAGSMPSHAEDAAQPWHIHVAAADDEGVVVADMWASPDEFGRFAQEEIMPAAQEAGVAGIDHKVLHVHNRIRGQAAAS
jgi:hypothetical protein